MKNPAVDAFLQRAPRWRAEMERLRSIALDCGLAESLKWGKPCYAVAAGSAGGNVALIQPFKTQCGWLFFQGALLPDPLGLLHAPGENSRHARRLLFTHVDQINAQEPELRAFIALAVRARKAGLKRPAAAPLAEPVPEDCWRHSRNPPRSNRPSRRSRRGVGAATSCTWPGPSNRKSERRASQSACRAS